MGMKSYNPGDIIVFYNLAVKNARNWNYVITSINTHPLETTYNLVSINTGRNLNNFDPHFFKTIIKYGTR